MRRSLPAKWWIPIVLIILGAIAPFGISGYWLRFITFIFMWIGLAGSLNLLTGYTGYLDFGHVAFFGIGAYTTGVLMVKLGMPFFPAMFIGAILAGILALLVGIPTMRLKGAYFAIAMLAFAEAMKQVALEFDGITGGGNGLSLPIYTNYQFFYYMMFSAVLLIIGTTYWFERSKFGKGLMAIREAELAAEVSGVNTFSCKLIAFGISAFVAGIIGGIYAYWMTFLYPGDTFNVLITVRMIIMAFLGGAGTLLGPIIGASFLAAIEEILWAEFKYTYLIIVGLIVVFVVLVLPRGLVGMLRQRALTK
ncbi:MAG: branched-chain amino acid ABC transporter permease [Deltaproteobacteria bacterium]|nr:branched-chain amino acid ABC transporter permease [Deltaproteobacteria bacterium]